jgi:hypothetical protein
MRPMCGIVREVRKGEIVVKIRSGQTHRVKTKKQFSLRQKVVILFDYISLDVKGVVDMTYFSYCNPVTPLSRGEYEDEESKDLEFFSFP